EKMLQQRCGHPHARIVPLKSAYEGCSQRADQKGIFSITFFTPSPTRIATQIGIWCAHHQATAMIFCIGEARFVSLLCRGPLQECRVPSLAKTTCLRKLCRWDHCLITSLPMPRTAESKPVQALYMIAPRNAQSWHGRIRAERMNLFVQRHPGK